MTYMDNRPDYLERARMHELLASSTEDAAARQMHQAMASEYRRRAGSNELGSVSVHRQEMSLGQMMG